EAWRPECLEELRRGPNPHLLYGSGERERSSVREPIEDRAQPEPVIAVTVRDEHGREVLAVPVDPLDQVVGLADGQQRVDEDRVPLARDHSSRYRRPGGRMFSRGQVAGVQRFRWSYKDIPTE